MSSQPTLHCRNLCSKTAAGSEEFYLPAKLKKQKKAKNSKIFKKNYKHY